MRSLLLVSGRHPERMQGWPPGLIAAWKRLCLCAGVARASAACSHCPCKLCTKRGSKLSHCGGARLSCSHWHATPGLFVASHTMMAYSESHILFLPFKLATSPGICLGVVKDVGALKAASGSFGRLPTTFLPSLLKISITEDLHGPEVATLTSTIGAKAEISITRPKLWSTDSPHLYQVQLPNRSENSSADLTGVSQILCHISSASRYCSASLQTGTQIALGMYHGSGHHNSRRMLDLAHVWQQQVRQAS